MEVAWSRDAAYQQFSHLLRRPLPRLTPDVLSLANEGTMVRRDDRAVANPTDEQA
jgi:hypothetical protein